MRPVAFAVILSAVAMQSSAADEPLTLIASIELPNVEGRIDHLAIDISGQKLFVAALGNNTVEVVDVSREAHLQRLGGFNEPQGIATLPKAGLVAVANGAGKGLQMVRTRDLQTGSELPLGEDADNVRYDAGADVVYVGYGNGALGAITADGRKVLGRVDLPGHPESFQLERTGNRIFVNVPAAGQILVVDRRALKVVGTWAVSKAKSNFPMALDEAGHRLFVGCRQPAEVLVYDTTSGKETGSVAVVGDTDDLFYDAARQRLYVAGGEGFIDVIDVRPPATPVRVARVKTAAGARTALFVPEQQRLYLAVPHRGEQRAEIRVYETRD